MKHAALLATLLLAYALLALGYARAMPPWNNPDEPAHFAYVEHVSTTGSLPELRAGDWDQNALSQLISEARFRADRVSFEGARYESHQPPLYYLVAAQLMRLGTGASLELQVLILRGLSIAFGALAIVAAYGLARTACPRRPDLWLATAGVFALVPMFTAISAAVSNDALSILLGTCAVWTMVDLAVHGVTRGRVLLVGALVGLLLLTKLTVYAFVPLLLATLAWASFRESGRVSRQVVTRPILAALIGALVSGWWFARNATLYGLTDPLATGRHDLVVVGQARWADLGLSSYESALAFAPTLFRSFWAQFGWMTIVVHQRIYVLYLVISLVALAGIVAYFAMSPRRKRVQPAVVVVLSASIVAVLVAVVFYNLTFVQPQGRYLFPALGPLSLVLSAGWLELARPDGRSMLSRVAHATPFAWIAAAIAVLIPYAFVAEPRQDVLILPVVSGAVVLGALSWKPQPLLKHCAVPSLLACLAALNAVCLLRTIDSYFAG